MERVWGKQPLSLLTHRATLLSYYTCAWLRSWSCSSATRNRNRMSSDALTIHGQVPWVSPSWEWRERKCIAASSQRSAPTHRQLLPFFLLGSLCVDRLKCSADCSGMHYGKPVCGTYLEPLVMPGGCSSRWWHQDAGKCPYTLMSHIPPQAQLRGQYTLSGWHCVAFFWIL